MMRVLLATSFVAVVVGLCSCGQTIESAESLDSLTLYSIDGNDYAPGKKINADEYFHGFPVLGKIDVKDSARRQKILDALASGIEKSDGAVAKCFWPRHGIRKESEGKVVEYVICFECLQLKKHEGEDWDTIPITQEPKDLYNEILKEEGIPLSE